MPPAPFREIIHPGCPRIRGWNATYTWPTPLSDGTIPTSHPIREGIERFFITDINNPAGSSQAQSTIAVMWDTILTTNGVGGAINPAQFNHVPGGANVLFMDGHVEYGKYPQPAAALGFIATTPVPPGHRQPFLVDLTDLDQ